MKILSCQWLFRHRRAATIEHGFIHPLGERRTKHAVIGKEAVLLCNTMSHNTVYCDFYDRKLSQTVVIAASGNVVSGNATRFRLSGNNLVILNVRQADEGLYECVEDDGLGLRHEVHLEVSGNL